MAYADQEMSGSKITSIIIVALIHIVIGYVLITGLAYEAVKNVVEKVTAVDIKEEVPDEPPPPPEEPKPDTAPPPPVAPPPPISIATRAPDIVTVTTPPPPAPPALVVPRPAPPAPPAPPPPPPSEPLKPKNSGWVTDADYRPAWVRREMAGVVSFSLEVTDGKVTGCSVTKSSGFSELDDATCQLIQRRARFNKASGNYRNSVRWQIPEN